MSNIPYNLIFKTKFLDFNLDYFMVLFESVSSNDYIGDVTIPTQVIKYNQCYSRQFSHSDCSIHSKLNYILIFLWNSVEILWCIKLKLKQNSNVFLTNGWNHGTVTLVLQVHPFYNEIGALYEGWPLVRETVKQWDNYMVQDWCLYKLFLLKIKSVYL